MSSASRRRTQKSLEEQVSDLRKRNIQLEKRLKQALRQLKLYEDNMVLDYDEEEIPILTPEPEPDKPDSDYIVVNLPNGTTRKIKKRV